MLLNPANRYAEILRNDFVAFTHRAFQELNPQSRFIPSWHIDCVAAKLEDVRVGRCRRLAITIPPRHLKSFIASVAFPAWVLGHNPGAQVIVVSYGQDLADKLARDCRALMCSSFYQSLFATRLSPERSAVAEFETTQGGYRLSTSVGGVLTGRGANIIIIDDPLKASDALSDSKRVAVNDWYDNTLRSRLNNQDDDAIILVMQRLHSDDLVAHVRRTERWDVISLAAQAERAERHIFQTPYGRRIVDREVGELLHRALLSERALNELRRSMTDYNFAAQFQQDPQPHSGLVVQRRWLKFVPERDKPHRFDRIVQSWDTANKVTELSDFSVCTTWGANGKYFYLLNVYRRRVEFPELKRTLRELADLWNATVVLVEDKSSGTQLIQQLRSEGFSRIQAAPELDGDKIMRLRAQTAQIEGGFVLFPEEAHWLDDYLRELLSFPNSKYDDQVDSTVFALAWNTMNQQCLWTDEAIANLGRVTAALAFGRTFGF
jgi:predicted phage terminase large subunit-like protein